MSENKFEQRVIDAANTVLKRSKSVGPLELLQQLEFLNYVHLEQWKKGHPLYDTLESYIQCGEGKLRKTYEIFRKWAQDNELRSIEATYQRTGARGKTDLQVTTDGDPAREQFFRLHYVQAGLTEKQVERVEAKVTKPPDLSVFVNAGDRSCFDCKESIEPGDYYCLERGDPLCLTCADLDHLEFLPSGDATLSRRARKNSPLAAIVLKFNGRRKRYERQGILVTWDAIVQAEKECEDDAASRAKQRTVAARRRVVQDQTFVTEFRQAILRQFPECPIDEATQIAEHAAVRGSGRVGRSAAGQSLDPNAVKLAVIASIRHRHTDYDVRLMRGEDRQAAREAIQDEIQTVLYRWSGSANL